MEPDVLKEFAQGDLDAFEALFRRFQGEVYGWIVTIIRDPGAAEDLTLETFWRVYRARARFDPDREFAPWARRIATNLALGHLKTASRRELFFDERPQDLAANAAPDSDEQREIRQGIRVALAQLPPKLQAVAILALLEEKPYCEIAEALGISISAVKSREFRAVRLLRKKLELLGVAG